MQVAGASISGLLVAGCLSTGDPGTDDENTDDRDRDGSLGDDIDEMTIDGRLHNEAGEKQTFAVTIRDAEGSEVASDEWEVGAGETVPVPAFGKPGEPRTFEVTVDGATESETLEFDVEAEPGKKAGYVEITYTSDGTIEIVFTPVGDGGSGLARVEAPPYEISEPECSGMGDRDPLWLCENMAAEPSVAFDQVETTFAIFAGEGLTLDAEPDGEHQFYAALLTETDDLDRLNADAGGDPVALIEKTDFDTEAVLVAQTGWGSGSVTPHLKRIEDTGDGIHAFGCYRRPCAGTDDYTMRTVVARFERPDSLEEGIVSLTVDAEHRVNFEAGEGVVTVTDVL